MGRIRARRQPRSDRSGETGRDESGFRLRGGVDLVRCKFQHSSPLEFSSEPPGHRWDEMSVSLLQRGEASCVTGTGDLGPLLWVSDLQISISQDILAASAKMCGRNFDQRTSPATEVPGVPARRPLCCDVVEFVKPSMVPPKLLTPTPTQVEHIDLGHRIYLISIGTI